MLYKKKPELITRASFVMERFYPLKSDLIRPSSLIVSAFDAGLFLSPCFALPPAECLTAHSSLFRLLSALFYYKQDYSQRISLVKITSTIICEIFFLQGNSLFSCIIQKLLLTLHPQFGKSLFISNMHHGLL